MTTNLLGVCPKEVEMQTSEPHEVSAGGMSETEARRDLRLIENDAMAELNGLFMKYCLGECGADAITVRRRLRNMAEGTLQFYHRQSLTPTSVNQRP